MTKACGPDLISPRLLKEGATILPKPLYIIFNRSLLQGCFPSNWKDVNVTAIYKKADKSMPSNYSTMSLLIQIGKAMESVFTSTFTITYQKTTFLHLSSLVLFKVTLQPSNFYTHTTLS